DPVRILFNSFANLSQKCSFADSTHPVNNRNLIRTIWIIYFINHIINQLTSMQKTAGILPKLGLNVLFILSPHQLLYLLCLLYYFCVSLCILNSFVYLYVSLCILLQ